MMDCAQAREEFSALLDGELTPEASAAVKAHLAECSECLRELEQLKRLDRTFRNLVAKKAPGDFDKRIAAAIRPSTVHFRRPALRHRSIWPLAAAVAAMLLVAVSVFLRMPNQGERFNLASQDALTAASPETAPSPLSPANAEVNEPAPSAPQSARAPAAAVEVGPGGQDMEQLRAIGYLQDEGKSETSEHSKSKAAPVPQATPGHDGDGEAAVAGPPKGAGASLPSRAPAKPVTADLPAEEKDRLSALGYMGDEAGAREGKEESAAATVTDEEAAFKDSLGVPRKTESSSTEARQSEPPVLAPVPEAPRLAPTAADVPAPPPAAAPPPPMPTGSAVAESIVVDETAGQGPEAQAAPEPPKQAEAPFVAALPPSPASPQAMARAGERGSALELGILREAGGRTFERRDEAWVQMGYAGQKTVKLMIDSEKFSKLKTAHKELADVVALGGRVIFRVEQKWYELRPPES